MTPRPSRSWHLPRELLSYRSHASGSGPPERWTAPGAAACRCASYCSVKLWVVKSRPPRIRISWSRTREPSTLPAAAP